MEVAAADTAGLPAFVLSTLVGRGADADLAAYASRWLCDGAAGGMLLHLPAAAVATAADRHAGREAVWAGPAAAGDDLVAVLGVARAAGAAGGGGGVLDDPPLRHSAATPPTRSRQRGPPRRPRWRRLAAMRGRRPRPPPWGWRRRREGWLAWQKRGLREGSAGTRRRGGTVAVSLMHRWPADGQCCYCAWEAVWFLETALHSFLL